MVPPWIVLATDKQVIGGEVPAVQSLNRGSRDVTLLFTFSLEKARRFSDEPAATMFARKCQKLEPGYLFTPYKLY